MKTPTPSLRTIEVVPPDESQVLPVRHVADPPAPPAARPLASRPSEVPPTVRDRAPRRPDERGKLFVRVLAANLDRLESAAFLERRTRQEIVDDALAEWLTARGY